jgi:hypothetical protein
MASNNKATNKKIDNLKVWNAAHAGNLHRLKYLLTDKRGLEECVKDGSLINLPNLPKVLVRMPRACDGSTPIFAAAAVCLQ